MIDELYLSPQEIARRLDVTDRAVLDMIKSGKLPGIRVGEGRGVWRVRQTDYVAYIQARREGQGREPETVA